MDERQVRLACGTQNQNSESNLDTLLPHALKPAELGCSSNSQSYRIQEYEKMHHQRSNPRGLQSTSQIFPYFRDFSNTNSQIHTNSVSLRASMADKSPQWQIIPENQSHKLDARDKDLKIISASQSTHRKNPKPS